MSDAASENLLEISSFNASVAIDLEVGHIRDLVFRDLENEIRPLHTAPWVSEDPAGLPEGLEPVLRRLSGDFLCAPFGKSDNGDAPLHGWSANSAWAVDEVYQEQGTAYAKVSLNRDILGAKVEKEVLLLAGTPLLFQTHRLTGGQGSLPVAHHVMTRMRAGGMFCHSRIDHAWTHEEPVDRRLNLLAYPANSKELSSFPREEGGIANLGEYPLAGGYEDFFTLVENRGNTLGWTAVQRKAEDDIVFVVKDAARMPVTTVWHSNGGRRHKPWSSRHVGVLGIMDGVSYGMAGKDASVALNHLSNNNIPTSVDLVPDGKVELSLIIGAMPRPDNWTKTASITIEGEELVLSDRRNSRVAFPVVRGFFQG